MRHGSISITSGSTVFLRVVILLIGLGVAVLCVGIMLLLLRLQGGPMYTPILFGMLIPAIPFFIALYQAMVLLSYIDKNQVFSNLSVTALKCIKYCGFSISALYTLGMPYLFYVADQDDAPGVALLGFIFIFGSLVVGTAAGVFQNLLQNVIDIKSENELTV